MKCLSEIDPKDPDDAVILNQFREVMQQFLQQNQIFDFEETFIKMLASNDPLFIFNGMDEVPHALRKQARLWIEAVLRKVVKGSALGS